MTVPETIRETILKIKALHDGATTDGERAAAAGRLNALLDKYGLTLADFTEPEKKDYEFRYFNAWQKRLLYQVVGHVTGCLSSQGYDYALSRSKTRVWFELTLAQAIDVQRLYDYYQEAFEEELKDFMSAFIQKHRLGVAVEGKERPERTLEELLKEAERLLKQQQLQKAMQDRPSPLANGYLGEGD
jgi:hypothetical protein